MDIILTIFISIFSANILGAVLNGFFVLTFSSPFDKPEDELLTSKFIHTLFTHLLYALFCALVIVIRILCIFNNNSPTT